MNKLSLSCLKSLVQTRPKGDWDFMTQLVLVWPEAKNYYWDKRGFRTLLGSWPLTSSYQPETLTSFLWLPEGMVLHGLQMESTFYSLILRFYEQGEYLLSFQVHNTGHRAQWMKHFPHKPGSWKQLDMLVWTRMATEMMYPCPLKPEALVHLYQEYPVVKKNALRALNLARDLGKTDIKTLNTLAALTHKSLSQDPRTCF